MQRAWLEKPGLPGWWRGPHGVRAAWRVAMFLLLTFAFTIAGAFLIPRGLLRGLLRHGELSPALVSLSELMLLIPVLAATFIMTSLEGRAFLSCGLGGVRRLRRLASGGVAGLALMTATILLIAVTGHASLRWGGLGPAAALGFALAWAGASLLIGVTEELLLRGYLLQAIGRGLGFWPALAITSLIFGALHVSNGGEAPAGIADVTLAGALLALGVRGTGTLWWSIGLHGAWDYTENFLLGTPDSGQLCAGTLLRTAPRGAALLSGGATGPEGSLLALAVLLAALALAWRAFPAPKN